MKLFIFSLFVIVTSMVSGIAIAELSYFILLIIKYLALRDPLIISPKRNHV
ncbi:hypothetical protein BvCmsHHP025_03524 [Escherichia coli]|nr:hypothetical protein BvCmsHHP025_03524 [Escherichia coli]